MSASPPQTGARHLQWGRQGVMIAMATRLTLYVAIGLVSSGTGGSHDGAEREGTRFTCN